MKDCCTNIQKPRDGKTVYIGQTFRDVTYTLSDKTEKTVGIRTIYEITERTIDKNGQYFIVPDIELGTYWTNLSLSDQSIIDLYHAHGESEQYHSEIRTDMDVERLPSGKFDSNKLVLEFTVIAYNILRIIGQKSLKKRDDPGQKVQVFVMADFVRTKEYNHANKTIATILDRAGVHETSNYGRQQQRIMNILLNCDIRDRFYRFLLCVLIAIPFTVFCIILFK